MSKTKTQSFKNHAKLDPWFHIVLLSILTVNLILSIVHLARHFSFHSGWLVVLSLAVFILYSRLRQYPMKVQDRVIRLEERLRLQALASAEWRAQIYRLTEDQLIGLRFAEDEEVVKLAKEALEQDLTRKQIKQCIRNWRPDYWRI